MAAKRIPIEERLLRYSDRSGGPDACWNWTGSTHSRRGYGRIGINGKLCVASRVSYEFYIRPIPTSMFVCHHCDNPPCINPKHLFLGTPADNVKDRDEKGRHIGRAPKHIRRGEESNLAKMTTQQVLEIRKLHKQGISYRLLAQKFDISKTNVADIIHCRIWTHVPDVTEQINDASFMEMLIITAPDGTEQVIHDVPEFCKKHHLNYSTLMRVARSSGKGTAYSHHKGYKARFS